MYRVYHLYGFYEPFVPFVHLAYELYIWSECTYIHDGTYIYISCFGVKVVRELQIVRFLVKIMWQGFLITWQGLNLLAWTYATYAMYAINLSRTWTTCTTWERSVHCSRTSHTIRTFCTLCKIYTFPKTYRSHDRNGGGKARLVQTSNTTSNTTYMQMTQIYKLNASSFLISVVASNFIFLSFSPRISIHIFGNNISPRPSSRNLGVILNSDFNLVPHINSSQK